MSFVLKTIAIALEADLPKTVTFASLGLSFTSAPDVILQSDSDRVVYPNGITSSQFVINGGTGGAPPFNVYALIGSDSITTTPTPVTSTGTDDMGSGRPTIAAIVNTNPKQLRFKLKFDENYTIRCGYIPMPPEITTLTQELYTPSQVHHLVYLKFVELIAGDMGEDDIQAKFKVLYEQQRQREKNMAKAGHLTKNRIPFGWFA